MKASPHLLVDFGSYSLKLALVEIQNFKTTIKKREEIVWDSEKIRPIKGDINHLEDEELDQLIDFIRKKIKLFSRKYQRVFITYHSYFIHYGVETTESYLLNGSKIAFSKIDKLYNKKLNENQNIISLNLKNFKNGGKEVYTCPKKVAKSFEINWNTAYTEEKNLKIF